MFEEKTYEQILSSYLARVPDNVSKRMGDVVYDMLSPCAWEDAEFYFVLRFMGELLMLPTSTGEFLDMWGWIVGLPRIPATPSLYKFNYDGTRPDVGTRFFLDQQYFELIESEENGLCLESEAVGRNTAKIVPGTAATPMVTVHGLESASFGELLIPGIETETDDDYRERIRQKIAGPAENGNKQHYKTWCESVTGVGRAKIIPLFAGENTVLAVLFDPEGKPVVQSVINDVQEYVDPMTLGKTVDYDGNPAFPVGDGLGNGVANIGAHFAAIAATPVQIAVRITITLARGYALEDARRQAQEAIAGYFRSVALGTLDENQTRVRISEIGAAVLECPAIEDYGVITLNGRAQNIHIGYTSAPVLSEVKISATV